MIGMPCGLRGGGEPAGGLEPGQLRQLDVHDDQVGSGLPRGGHARLPVDGLDQAIGGAGKQVADDLAIELVVLDVEDRLHATGSWATRTGIREEEGRALPLLALHPDPTPVQLDQPLGDREAEPGPAELPADRDVRLPELLEDVAHLVGRDPDPGVRHREQQIVALHLDPDLHVPLPGELQRIAGQVDQTLGEAFAVAEAERRIRAATVTIRSRPFVAASERSESLTVLTTSSTT